jgi:single-stranded DNA-binding protein
MNQIILMAEVLQPPQTRYTPDQTEIAETQARYPGLRPEDPAGTLKIVAFGNGAQSLQEQCQPGQWFVFEGRLRMNRVERDGFKETVPELSVSHFYPMGNPPATAPASAQAVPPVVASRKVDPAPAMAGAGAGDTLPDYTDDIPF